MCWKGVFVPGTHPGILFVRMKHPARRALFAKVRLLFDRGRRVVAWLFRRGQRAAGVIVSRVDSFGCPRCWPADADGAWKARDALTRESELVDESHFHVMILACKACEQRFLSVFTEMVDWADGEDPQAWTLLPITAAEAAELIAQRDIPSEAQLNLLGGDRKSLRRDHPKAAPARNFWITGMTVPPHD